MSTEMILKPFDREQKDSTKSERWTSVQARKQMEDWQRSGMSMTAFCRERGIQARRLYYWRSRLEEWSGKKHTRKTNRGCNSNWDFEGCSDQKSLRWAEARITCADRDRVSNPALAIRLVKGQGIDIFEPERVEVNWLLELTHGLYSQLSR